MNYNLLFDELKNQEFNKVYKLIDSSDSDDMDLNLRDNIGNYIINYVVIFNQPKLLELLIEKGARIDVTDADGRSLLYYPIKYNYYEIVKMLVEYNTKSVGISIHNIKDKKNNIALHYAIKYKNLKIVQLLLQFGSNPNSIDSDGNNSLHMAIFTRNYEICKSIINNNININSRTNIGETALHIAANLQDTKIFNLLINDLNIEIDPQDYEHEYTPLLYSVNISNIEQVIMLLKKGANPNLQDIYGNTAIHYTIIEENLHMLHFIIKYSTNPINYNLWNIDGKLPLHLALSIESQYTDQYVEILLQKTDVNIPDNNGNSCLILLCKNNTWYKFIDVLVEKKLDISVENSHNKRSIDYIENKDINLFTKMIVDSYENRLKKSKIWNEEWENICHSELSNLSGITEEDKKKIGDLGGKLSKNVGDNKLICRSIIENRIKNIIENRNSNANMCSKKSYPTKREYVCVNIDEKNSINFCTFTGSTLDILIGLLYLLKKHPDTCSTINSNFVNNENLCTFYRNMGVEINSKCDFMNFEIVWVYGKLYVTSNFTENFSKCIANNNKRFIIIPLGIELQEGSHANYLIYDKKLREIERFEPHGSSNPPGFNYHPDKLDTVLEKKIMDIDKNITYISPLSYLPKIGFQIFDVIEKNKKKIGDPGGFCALWSIWYVDLRLTYPDMNRRKLVSDMIPYIRNQKMSFKNLIRNYSKNITDLRDMYLKKINIDINDWINDNVSDKNLEILISLLSSEINNLS